MSSLNPSASGLYFQHLELNFLLVFQKEGEYDVTSDLVEVMDKKLVTEVDEAVVEFGGVAFEVEQNPEAVISFAQNAAVELELESQGSEKDEEPVAEEEEVVVAVLMQIEEKAEDQGLPLGRCYQNSGHDAAETSQKVFQ